MDAPEIPTSFHQKILRADDRLYRRVLLPKLSATGTVHFPAIKEDKGSCHVVGRFLI